MGSKNFSENTWLYALRLSYIWRKNWHTKQPRKWLCFLGSNLSIKRNYVITIVWLEAAVITIGSRNEKYKRQQYGKRSIKRTKDNYGLSLIENPSQMLLIESTPIWKCTQILTYIHRSFHYLCYSLDIYFIFKRRWQKDFGSEVEV